MTKYDEKLFLQYKNYHFPYEMKLIDGNGNIKYHESP